MATGEAQVPPPPWQRLPARPARRRRKPISREAIVAAAVRLLDRDGLAALSMRRLADELGTGAASLYWHVGSKDGLLDLVFDEVIGELQVPDPEPGRWQEQLKDVARAQRDAILRHPWAVRVSIGRVPLGPNAMRYSERVLAILRGGGLPPHLAVQGYFLLIAAVNGFTRDETGLEDSDAAESASAAGGPSTDGPGAGAGGPGAGGPGAGAGGAGAGGPGAGGPGAGGGGEDAPSPQEVGNMVRDYIASLPAATFPTMVGLADEFAFADADERFELLVDIFVDGLARQAAAR